MTEVEVYTSKTHPVNDVGNGYFTMNYPVGQDTVASLQEDGTFQPRPKGTNGVFERCLKVTGGLLFQSFVGGDTSKPVIAKLVAWFQVP